MATIKSYTDIEQSKKLTEILPLDSADMYYCYGMDIHTNKWDYDIVPTIIDASNQVDICDIPCWSLAALLGIVCEVKRMDYSDKWEAASWNKSPAEQEYYVDVEGYDNPVDACVALIEKLHELNLL